MPDSICVNGSELVSKYLGNGKWTKVPCMGKCNYAMQAIADMNQAINDYHQPRGETEYVSAYKQRIGKFTTYYNANCATTAPVVDPGAANNPGTIPITIDPATGNTVVPGSGSSTTTTSSSDSGTVPTAAQGTIMDKLKTVPKWVYYAGGGLLVLTVIIVIARRSN